MEIFNVSLLELLFILVVVYVVMGPESVVRTAGKLGQTIQKFSKSSLFKVIRGTYRDLVNFSEDILRKSGIDSGFNEIDESDKSVEFNVSRDINNKDEKPVDAKKIDDRSGKTGNVN